MQKIALAVLAGAMLAGCGGAPAPSLPAQRAGAAEARWGKVTFSAELEKPRDYKGKPALPAPFLVLTGTPKLGEPVVESYVLTSVAGKTVGYRYLFLGTDGHLYASREIDESGNQWYLHPKGPTYHRVGTYERPATLTDRMPVTFELAKGAKLERHKQFAGIRWDTWISLDLPQAPVVQSPPLVRPEDVKPFRGE